MTYLTDNRIGSLLSWIGIVLWTSVIFWFSAQPSDESATKSLRILTFFLSLGIDLKYFFGNYAILLVRKAAHFTEFFILACLIQNHFKIYNYPKLWIGWCLATFFACTDELHQAFVPGRGPALFDIMIDSLGAFLGNLCFVLIFYQKKI